MQKDFFHALASAVYSEERWQQDTIYLQWKREEEALRGRYVDRLVHSYTHEPWRTLRWGLPPIEGERRWNE